MQLAVVILAAGASSRMGQPKLLLPWGKTTVLGHLVAQWQQVGAAEIGVAIAAGDVVLNEELDRLQFPRDQRILNPDPVRGMFSSVQCAARWAGWRETITHWALTLGDQPHLAPATLRSLVEFSAVNPGSICQPSQGGRAKHPVVLPKRFFKELHATSHATLKEFLTARRDSTRLIELPDPGLDFDLDTPADYDAARQRFLSPPTTTP